MKELKGACIIGQSGGPTSAINASTYGAIKTALESENITAVYGALNGIKEFLRTISSMSKEDRGTGVHEHTPSSAGLLPLQAKESGR